MSAESDSFSPQSADQEPTRALLLAQALETCIQAERRVPGSADYVIARQPAWARAELRRLVALAGSLDAAADSAVMSEEFRVGARARLMRRIARETSADYADAPGQNGHIASDGPWLTAVPSVSSRNGHHARRRRSNVLWRGGLGGLLAAVLIGAATLTASANALPGDPLYTVKQAREELGIRFASDDEARTLALLNRADARLDETARLLQQGRTEQVTQTTQQYDDTVARATTTYVVTIAAAPPAEPATVKVEDKLNQQQEQLLSLLDTAPEPARSDLREALDAAERGRALVADPQPGRRGSRPASAAAAPTAVVEVEADVEPTTAPTSAPVQSVPPPVDLVAQPTAQPIADDAERREGRSRSNGDSQEGDASAPPTVTTTLARGGSAVSARSDVNVSSSGRRQGQKLEDVKLVPAPAVAVQEGIDADQGAQVVEVDHGDGVGDHGDGALRSNARGDGGDAQAATSTSDRVVAPSQNEGDDHTRVAEQAQPTAGPVQAAVTQRSASSASDGDANRSSQSGTVAQSTGSGTARTTTRDGDGSSAPRAVAPSAQPTARVVQATPVVANQSSSDDHHGDDSSSSSGSTRTGTTSGSQTSGSGSVQTSSPSRTSFSTFSTQSSTTRSTSGSSGGDHDSHTTSTSGH